VVWDVRRRSLPRNAVVRHTMPTSGGRAEVTSDDLGQVANFAFLYLGTYVLGVALLLAAGCSLRDSAFEFASALATTGLSVAVTSPTAPALVLWAEIGGMFLGRWNSGWSSSGRSESWLGGDASRLRLPFSAPGRASSGRQQRVRGRQMADGRPSTVSMARRKSVSTRRSKREVSAVQ